MQKQLSSEIFNLYKEEFYHYVHEQGWFVGKTSYRNVNFYTQADVDYLSQQPLPEPNYESQTPFTYVDVEEFKPCIDFHRFPLFTLKCIADDNEKKRQRRLNWDAYVHFFNKYPEYRNDILPFYSELAKTFDTTCTFHAFLQQTTTTFEDVTHLITQTNSLESWLARSFNPNHLLSLLQEKNGEKEQIDDFLFSYYSQHTSEELNNSSAYILRDFLLERFETTPEKLEPYIPLIVSLQRHFSQPELDFFNHQEELSTTLCINLKKMEHYFSIDGYSKVNYEKSFIHLLSGLKKYYNLDTLIHTHKDHMGPKFTQHASIPVEEGDFIATFIHNNPSFTRTVAEQRLMQLFQYILKNPTFEVNADSVNSLFIQQDLEKSLACSQENTPSRKI